MKYEHPDNIDHSAITEVNRELADKLKQILKLMRKMMKVLQ